MISDEVALERTKSRGEDSDDPTNILSQCSLEAFQSFRESMEPAREGEQIYEVVSDENIFESVDEVINFL